jgi:PAS domain S-box-containing protein
MSDQPRSKSRPPDVLEEMDQLLKKAQKARPRLKSKRRESKLRDVDLEALLDVSKAINSTLVLDDILQMVMKKAIKLLGAERGFLMLLDSKGDLQFKTAHNICKDSLSKEDLRISMSIANKVAQSGESIYTSDAQKDKRFSKQKSIMELNLKSIMCVPLKNKEKIIGILYLDNSTKKSIFLESDLHLFGVFAGQAAIAIENASLYEDLLALKVYNENVVNRTPMGIVVVDNNLKITIANTASQKIFQEAGWKNGLDSFPFSDLTILDLVPEVEKKRWKKICYQVLYTGKPFEEAKSYHKFKKEELALSLKVSPLQNIDNRTVGLIIVVEDITEKVVLERYLILSQKLAAKGEMASSIGHELNNYLTIISNNAELLSLNLQKNNYQKMDSNAKGILESINTMKRFTDGLIDFSSLKTQKVEYDVKTLIEDLLFSLKTQPQFSEMDFVTHFDSLLPLVNIDVGQIQQVLLNIINNSADAIQKKKKGKGEITITTSYLKDQEQLEIKVTDNGVGIPEENINKVFEPRFTTKKKGHGIGLVTCKKIVENHKGKILVESQKGKGSTFSMVLPVKANPDQVNVEGSLF